MLSYMFPGQRLELGTAPGQAGTVAVRATWCSGWDTVRLCSVPPSMCYNKDRAVSPARLVRGLSRLPCVSERLSQPQACPQAPCAGRRARAWLARYCHHCTNEKSLIRPALFSPRSRGGGGRGGKRARRRRPPGRVQHRSRCRCETPAAGRSAVAAEGCQPRADGHHMPAGQRGACRVGSSKRPTGWSRPARRAS